MNYSYVIALAIDVVFPAGVAIGSTNNGNHTEIDTNGKSEPVLRGTSLAGVLRHAYSTHFSKEYAATLFGSIKEEATRSRIQFFDSVLNIGAGKNIVSRTHIAVNRHWGNVEKGGLFSFSSAPPNTTSKLIIQIFNENLESLKKEAEEIASLFSLGLLIGGSSNRGIGLMKLLSPIKSKLFELNELEDCSNYIDNKREWKSGDYNSFNDASELIGEELLDSLLIDVSFNIPEGQDLYIENANGKMTPTATLAADGKTYWQLPGSSVRGVIKSFITKLAAKENTPVADTFSNFTSVEADQASSQKAWLFAQPEEGNNRKPELHKKYKVASLFGSLHAAGRLHIADSFIPLNENSSQIRAHVAIDGITGGAIEGMLFKNEVLTSEVNSSDSFTSSIIIRNPEEHEIKWLISALKAIDSGYLRLGSSKASGRLEISSQPESKGKLKEKFIEIWKEMS